MRCLSMGFAAFLFLCGQFLLCVPDLKANANEIGSVQTDDGTIRLTLGTGVKSIMLPHYGGSDTITYGDGLYANKNTNTSYSDEIWANTISFDVYKDTPLSVPGFSDIRFVFGVSYAGGSDRQSVNQAKDADIYIVTLSIDPAYNWLGGVGGNSASVYNESVEISEHEIDLYLALEGRASEYHLTESVALTPIVYAGLLAQRQETSIWTSIAQVGSFGDYDTLDEVLLSKQVGPELRGGFDLSFPGDVAVSVMANVAWLTGTVELDAHQTLSSINGWNPIGRSPVPYADRQLDDSFSTFLYGFSLHMDAPIVNTWRVGLDLTARYCTNRPSIVNPTQLTGSVIGSLSNPGVLIDYDNASELGVMVSLSYSF